MRCRLLLSLLVAAPVGAQSVGAPLALPVRYDAHRFFVRPVTDRGDTLELYTDTGGGLFLFSDVVARLALPREMRGVQGTDTAYAVSLPAFRRDAAIPPPAGSAGGKLFVLDAKQRLGGISKSMQGMLGQDWFAGRVWTFDYPGRRLLLRAAGDVPRLAPAHVVPLAFKSDSAGRRTLNFPRIRVEIDGDSLDLLFDTGASARIPAAALATLGDGGPAERGTSFITTEIFDRWRARHPDWRVIDDADELPKMAMIEVPRISIAGHTVGPVWFTQRPDRNFHQYMSQWMDRRVDGALGGSALHYFRVTVDYPAGKGYFELAGNR